MANRRRVLVLDDSPVIHAKLEILFREQDVALTCTSKWTEVSDLCDSDEAPDLLILDLNMPEIRGEIVGMGVKERGIPIVVFSSEAESRRSTAAQRIGARAAIEKTDDEGLVSTVMSLLEEASSC
jgi:DNA-binding NtrC family response regulator